MANEWYYAKDGQQLGPVSAKELKNLADAGQLQGSDLVWKEGMADWKPAAEVKGLVGGRPAAAAGPAVASGGASPRQRLSRYRSPMGQVLLIIAGVILIGQMCVPWWSMTSKDDDSKEDDSNISARQREFQKRAAQQMLRTIINGRDSELERLISSFESAQKRLSRNGTTSEAVDKQKRALEHLIKFTKIAKKDRKWWKAHLKQGDKSLERRMMDDWDKSVATYRIWGWNEGVGIMGLVFGIVVIVLSIVFVSVPVMRNWSWIVSIIATVMGVIVLIFALIWIFTAPGKDSSPLFKQGMIIGPYMFLGGGVMFLLVGIFDMIFGLSFLTRMRRLRAQR